MKKWPLLRGTISSILLSIIASEIWPEMRGGLWQEWSYKRGATILLLKYC